jgi:hypothetical protein
MNHYPWLSSKSRGSSSGQFWRDTIDEAFEALNRAAELHSWFGLIKYEPLLEGLWNDPRFAEFCKKVGLPP